MATENFITRNLRRLRGTWQSIAGSAPSAQGGNAGLTSRQLTELREQMNDCIVQPGGEFSSRARAAKLGEVYLGLGSRGRKEFLQVLAGFGPDPRILTAAARSYLDAGEDASAVDGERGLREAVRSPRAKILTQFTALPDGVKFLVDLRADLLELAPGDPRLELLERELEALLALWFDVGFLHLSRITWDSPASLLERLIAYEAVHEIRSWEDLRNRLDSDRRCYAFFHPRMPREPLIFVEVALARGLAGSIQLLLDERSPPTDAGDADTAIFYSISSTQKGLRGISFGNFLIKRVVEELGHESPKLKAFATLSPIPGLRRWLESDAAGALVLPEAMQTRLKRAGLEARDARALGKVLAAPGWHVDAKAAAALKDPSMHVCAHYLVNARNGLRPLDPVARFHLDNGARIERVNWRGDTSAKGLRQSAGMMVNYLYDLGEIEKHHEAYRLHARIALSSELRRLLKG
jgi:malonyl-CoA decarboxylase